MCCAGLIAGRRAHKQTGKTAGGQWYVRVKGQKYFAGRSLGQILAEPSENEIATY